MTWPSKFSYRQQLSGFREDRYVMGKTVFFYIFFWSSSCHEVILRATWTIFSLYTTGGPSSSCEMIILRNNSHGGIIRVCVGIFTAALRNKIIRQILKKNTSPYFYSVTLVIWPLTLMKRTHFSELSISTFSTFIRKAQGWTLHFRMSGTGAHIT